MDAREDDRGIAASSFECSAAREGSGVRDSKKLSIAGPAGGGTREYECSDTRPRCRIKRASASDVGSVAANYGWERSSIAPHHWESEGQGSIMQLALATTDNAVEAPFAIALWREYHNHSGFAPTRNHMAPAMVRLPPAGTPVRPHQRLWFTFIEDTQNQRALVPLRDNPDIQVRSSRPSVNIITLSEIIVNAPAWSNGAETRGGGTQLVSGSQVEDGLRGRRCLARTCQRARRGTTR